LHDGKPRCFDHYVVSIPTVQFYDNNIANFCQQLGITRDRLKFRGDRTGYCGRGIDTSASRRDGAQRRAQDAALVELRGMALWLVGPGAAAQ